MQLKGSVVVNRPVEKVFAHLLDLERSPEWADDFGVVERRKLSDGPTGVGTRFHAVDRLFGLQNVYEVEITELEQGRYLAAAWSEPNRWRLGGPIHPACRRYRPDILRADEPDRRAEAHVASHGVMGEASYPPGSEPLQTVGRER